MTKEILIEIITKNYILWDVIDMLTQSNTIHETNIELIREHLPKKKWFNTTDYNTLLIQHLAEYIIFQVKLGQINLDICHYLNSYIKDTETILSTENLKYKIMLPKHMYS